MSTQKRLYRSQTDRQVAGVCGGLADYFNVDATLVRIIFLLLFFGMGNGFIIYAVLWMIMPEETDVRVGAKTKRKNDDLYDEDLYEDLV